MRHGDRCTNTSHRTVSLVWDYERQTDRMNIRRAASIRRKLAITAGFTALAAASAVGLAGPASAGTACSSGYHCVFYLGYDSAKHSYFNSDSNFTDDTFNQTGLNGGSAGMGQNVNDNLESASNSSTGGYESHYYLDINYGNFLFCVNPGSQVQYLPAGQTNEASSLQLTGSTTTHCY